MLFGVPPEIEAKSEEKSALHKYVISDAIRDENVLNMN